MGNHPSSSSSSGHRPPATGKVILQDGSIQEFNTSLTVAELMLEYPQQVVVELKELALATKRPTPLPADNKLEVDKIYVMVPLRRGKPSRFSVQEIHHLLLRVNNAMVISKPTSRFVLPLLAKIVGIEDVDRSKNGIRVLNDKDEQSLMVWNDDGFVEGLEEMKEDCHLSRRFSGGRGWKPSLDTIVEKKNEIRKGSKWVVVASKLGKRIQSKGLVWG